VTAGSIAPSAKATEITRGGVDANGPWMSIIPRRCPECDGDGEVPLDD